MMIELRPANALDCELIYEWNNADDVRTVSINRGPLRWQSHREWFARKLVDPDCWLLIAVIDGEPAGLVRFDDDRLDNFATVSIVLAPDQRGRGIGTTVLRLACRSFCSGQPTRLLVAWILDDNAASLGCFTRAGFFPLTRRLLDGRAWNIYMRRAVTIATITERCAQ